MEQKGEMTATRFPKTKHEQAQLARVLKVWDALVRQKPIKGKWK